MSRRKNEREAKPAPKKVVASTATEPRTVSAEDWNTFELFQKTMNAMGIDGGTLRPEQVAESLNSIAREQEASRKGRSKALRVGAALIIEEAVRERVDSLLRVNYENLVNEDTGPVTDETQRVGYILANDSDANDSYYLRLKFDKKNGCMLASDIHKIAQEGKDLSRSGLVCHWSKGS